MNIFSTSRPFVGYTLIDEVGPDGIPTESGCMVMDIYAGTEADINGLSILARYHATTYEQAKLTRDAFATAHIITLAFHVDKLPRLASSAASYWPNIVATLFEQMYPGIKAGTVVDLHNAAPTIH